MELPRRRHPEKQPTPEARPTKTELEAELKSIEVWQGIRLAGIYANVHQVLDEIEEYVYDRKRIDHLQYLIERSPPEQVK